MGIWARGIKVSTLLSSPKGEKLLFILSVQEKKKKHHTIGSTLSDQTQVTKVIITLKRFKESQFREDS